MLSVVSAACAARVTRSPDVAARPAPAASLSAARRPIFSEWSFPATIAYLLCPWSCCTDHEGYVVSPSLRRLQLADIASRGSEEARSRLLDVGGRDVRMGHEADAA